MIAVVDTVIIVPMEIESETQLMSDIWQAISQLAKLAFCYKYSRYDIFKQSFDLFNAV